MATGDYQHGAAEFRTPAYRACSSVPEVAAARRRHRACTIVQFSDGLRCRGCKHLEHLIEVPVGARPAMQLGEQRIRKGEIVGEEER